LRRKAATTRNAAKDQRRTELEITGIQRSQSDRRAPSAGGDLREDFAGDFVAVSTQKIANQVTGQRVGGVHLALASSECTIEAGDRKRPVGEHRQRHSRPIAEIPLAAGRHRQAFVEPARHRSAARRARHQHVSHFVPQQRPEASIGVAIDARRKQHDHPGGTVGPARDPRRRRTLRLRAFGRQHDNDRSTGIGQADDAHRPIESDGAETFDLRHEMGQFPGRVHSQRRDLARRGRRRQPQDRRRDQRPGTHQPS
jgi:hypothetical protein